MTNSDITFTININVTKSYSY